MPQGDNMNIYVASSWRNTYQSEVVNVLRKHGFDVYDFKNPKKGDNGFHWSEIDPEWLNWSPDNYIKALSHPIAESGFKSDLDAMEKADICILVLPCGRSAHTEAGWMKGVGKRVYIYVPEPSEPELMYKIYDGVYSSLEEIIRDIEKCNA